MLNAVETRNLELYRVVYQALDLHDQSLDNTVAVYVALHTVRDMLISPNPTVRLLAQRLVNEIILNAELPPNQ